MWEGELAGQRARAGGRGRGTDRRASTSPRRRAAEPGWDQHQRAGRGQLGLRLRFGFGLRLGRAEVQVEHHHAVDADLDRDRLVVEPLLPADLGDVRDVEHGLTAEQEVSERRALPTPLRTAAGRMASSSMTLEAGVDVALRASATARPYASGKCPSIHPARSGRRRSGRALGLLRDRVGPSADGVEVASRRVRARLERLALALGALGAALRARDASRREPCSAPRKHRARGLVGSWTVRSAGLGLASGSRLAAGGDRSPGRRSRAGRRAGGGPDRPRPRPGRPARRCGGVEGADDGRGREAQSAANGASSGAVYADPARVARVGAGPQVVLGAIRSDVAHAARAWASRAAPSPRPRSRPNPGCSTWPPRWRTITIAAVGGAGAAGVLEARPDSAARSQAGRRRVRPELGVRAR